MDTLILAGPRLSELCGLDGPHIDLGAEHARVPREVTDKHLRTIARRAAMPNVIDDRPADSLE
ncbi:MAG: hypothetical protein ACRDKL_11305 [Solirubrobacteraceae bacterium]